MNPKRGALHAAVVVFAVAAGAWSAVASVEQSESPPSSAGEPEVVSASPREGPLVLAGSGSNLPLTQRLVRGWVASGGGVGGAQVLGSIGSSGGLHALSDGVIDIALVSRPLHAQERAAVHEVAYARAGIVVATRLELEEIDLRTLTAIYAGAQTETASGEPIVPILREEGDSTFEALALRDADFGEAVRGAQESERFRSVFTDQSMEYVLSTVHGALGLLDEGFLQAQATDVRSVPFGPVPTPEVLERGEYPYTKDLRFVLARESRGAANAFVEYVRSPAGQAIIREAGYMPLGPSDGGASDANGASAGGPD